MEVRSDIKTNMCSVLFLDIVEYSRKSVAGQISLKERFNEYLAAALCDVPTRDRIIFDADGGAVINFIGGMDDALNVALVLRKTLLDEDVSLEPSLLVRMGINLGPVRLIRGVNGQPDIVGDGINVAQRITGFAEANQILASRSYYDAVLHKFPQHAGMFHFQGSRTDNHVREHEVYAVSYPDDGAISQVSDQPVDSSVHVKLDQHAAISPQPESMKRVMLIGIVAVFAILMVVLVFKLQHRKEIPALPNVDPAQATSNAQQMPAASTDIENKVVEASGVQSTVKPDTKESALKKLENKQAKEQIKYTDFPSQPKAHARGNTSEMNKQAPNVSVSSGVNKSAAAYITIACEKGTEVFIDGMQKGKVGSEALTLAIPLGKHLVIVNHASGNIYSQHVDLEPGKTLRIKPNICK